MSTNLGNLAVIVRERGEYDEAEKLLRQALAIDEALLGPEHTYVGYDLNELAVVLRLRGRPDSAASILRRVLALSIKRAGVGHRNTIAVKVNLGRALREGGRYGEAAALFREALGQLPNDNADTDPFKVSATIGLGRSLVQLGKTDEALPLLQSALEKSTRKFGADNYRTGEAHLALGECFGAMKRGKKPSPRFWRREPSWSLSVGRSRCWWRRWSGSCVGATSGATRRDAVVAKPSHNGPVPRSLTAAEARVAR